MFIESLSKSTLLVFEIAESLGVNSAIKLVFELGGEHFGISSRVAICCLGLAQPS